MHAVQKLKRAMNSASDHASPVRRLFGLCIAASGAVALLAILGQMVIQSALLQQSRDTLVINTAQGQCELSERLSKTALALQVFPEPAMRQRNVDELRAVVVLWQRSQEGLQHGDAALGLPGNNSAAVRQLFARIEPNYEAILNAAKSLLAEVAQDPLSTTSTQAPDLRLSIQTILANEPGFLVGMDHIVSQYQQEEEDRVARLKQTELTLLGLLLLGLLLVGIFVIRPALQQLHQTIVDLTQANERITKTEFTRKKAERILALNEALAASQQVKPHTCIVAFGHYRVRDNGETYRDVYHREVEGRHVFECECLQYQQHMICAHSLAAAVLHSASLQY